MAQRKNRVIKNASWIIACRVIQAVLSFVIGTLSARYLGPSNYGIISYASSITSFLIPVVQLGFRATLVREIIADPEHEGRTVGTSLFMSTMASFLGIIGVIAFTGIANRGETDTIIVCGLYSLSLIFQATEMIEYWFQSKLLSKYVAVTSLISYVVVSAYRIFLLVSSKSVYWFALSQVFDLLLISVFLLLIYHRIGGQKLSVSLRAGKDLFSRSHFYIVSGLMVTIFSLTDRVMITLMIGEEANGYYSAAMTCAEISSFVFAAIVDSARPLILEAKKNNSPNFSKNISRLFSIIIVLALAQGIVMTLGAGLIIHIVYGDAYSTSVSTLQIITWYTAFAYIGSVRNIWILAEQKQKVLWKINMFGAILNIAVNYILIPIMGINGAAIASVGTQFITNFVLCFVIPSVRPVSRMLLDSINPFKIKELWIDRSKNADK